MPLRPKLAEAPEGFLHRLLCPERRDYRLHLLPPGAAGGAVLSDFLKYGKAKIPRLVVISAQADCPSFYDN